MATGGKTELAIDLDELRLLVGLSYRELARRTGCARSTLHDALTGRRFPRLDTVLAIARVCGGDTTRWRLRWVAACKRSSSSHRTDDVLAVDQSELTGVL
ncbi:helix-turn-helix domain-containing protein [Lentzea sp. NEAU-D7]|uniref:helix-turn-helix domain-containing protein n=1 Tax=Lentzea sp. NEAU-D7 TaxID=2994667 RepID=UPI00224A8F01|nr:helix-turn-helix transcriptional regulator [Lentzea sp. NEAU-D7]MCX2952715.1 helix-turn-helix transcriptional regulator [Lentzea sp. NEAU-D7]